jgi:uncharacterized RDD family membrane protein YckC
MTDTQAPAAGTQLGLIDVDLIAGRSGTEYATRTELRSASASFARSVPLIVGALLFAQRQMRMVSDPARFEIITRLQDALAAARTGRLAPPTFPASPRTVASYQIRVSANGTFAIQVDQKTDGLLADSAGAMVTGALAAELLTSLPEPYRAFYGEMIEAALPYWREHRPALGESTWNWGAALRRLDALARGASRSGGEPVTCPDCKSPHPADSACLHCGSTAEPVAPAAPLSSMLPASPGPGEPPVRPAPVVEAPKPNPVAPPPVAASIEAPPAPIPTAPADTGVKEYPVSIVPAQDIAPVEAVREPDPRLSWPLARLGRRFGAAVVDVLIAAVLGSIGGFGATTIALATGNISNDQAGATFFPGVLLIIAALYFILGWSSNESVGMLLFRLRILRQVDREPEGLFRAVVRAIGYLVALGVGLAIVLIGFYIDENFLPFVVGMADLVLRIIIGLIALYVIWSFTGQRLLE